MSLFAELQRRNVIRMAGLYLVGAWLLVQVAGTVLPWFNVSESLLRGLVVVLVIGFIPALVFAWVFEMTPDGIKRDDEVPLEQSIAPQTAQRMNRMIIAMLLLALVYFGVDKFVLAPNREAAKLVSEREADRAEVPAGVVPPAPAVSSKSIAVLPFENLSEEKSNAYFAEGIQDEILTRLSKISALKVISRTSTQRYASSPENVGEIAEQLGVANILEGSVQKAGNKVRINVQLIRADTDTHLWAETYDRDVADIFAVQSEIANSVTTALSATLTGEERKDLAELPTRNVAAYDAYLRGISFRDNGYFAKRRDAFKLATQLDPGFLQAWTDLAQAQMVMDFLNLDTSAEGDALASQALAKAVQLDPEAVPTQLALAYHKYWIERDYPAAAKLFQQLSARMPNSSDIPFALSRVTRRQMQWDQSLRYSAQAIALDPRNVMILGERGETYSWLRNYPEAIKAYQAALAVAPNDTHIRQEMIFAYQNAGRLDEAQKLLDQMPADELIFARVAQLSFRGNYPQAIALLKSKSVNGDDNYVLLDRLFLGLLQVRSGDMDAARQTLNLLRKDLQAAAQREPDNASIASIQGQTFALLGDKELALAAGRRAIKLLPVEVDPIFAHATEEGMAFIETQVGEHASAIARLTKLLKTPYDRPITVVALRFGPAWQPLRADPAFQKMLSDAESSSGEKR